ncbi:hypothetical protein ABZ519_19860 [Streptomyces collinus]|uniref:hypothetical protein n=1 Tax=Streptomyces collinus TaxID=42684 RepID=UPI0033C1A298
MDRHAWHAEYDRTESFLGQRLHVVQERIAAALDACAPDPVKVTSLCGGQGRDLIGVLAEHPRAVDVAEGMAPADLVLMCRVFGGIMCRVFGGITDDGIENTVGH